MERRELEADAVVVGSALGGLVAGAILARRGKRVVVLEHADTVGGRGGSVPHDGYWIDFGHRDGHDVGDCQVAWHHGVEAAREAGVEVTLRRVTAPLRVHHLPDGGVTTGGDWSAAGLAAMACAALSPGADSVEELRALVGRLAAAEPDEVARAIPETLGAWLGAHTRSAEVRRAILLMAAVVFHSHPEEASAGRFIQFLQRRAAGGAFIPDDGEVGGMQGLIEPWARALRTHGGEIALGWKPVEIVVDGGRVRGAVAVDRANLVREVRAPVAISTYPVWENFDLIDERLFPPDLAAAAWRLKAHRADLVGWQAGLRRLPAVRVTGHPDDHAGWNRLLAGPERVYRGGYQITSLTSRHAAPAGRHLLSLVMARFFRGGSTAGQPWTAARAALDEAIAYLRRFYADLDACLEWSAYQYVTAPQSMSWAWAPVVRHGLEVPGIDGLYLASSTLEAPAAVLDIGAYAGLAAARRALARLG
ncbi:MAG: NAD(P)/FAD-dependent oxidoreductase [Deltaproteobacteria bacterium]|nr:MAG: NAD(P)/FAD-dependent oxidoreductase [Deltaproteobacteria bacterium]